MILKKYFEILSKYKLEITTFFSGAVVMIFEFVGSRILGPYLGTSIFVWSSIIGIILGSLSLGYYYGGKLADKKANFMGLAVIIFLGAFFIGFTLVIKDILLFFLLALNRDIRVVSLISSLILFTPASFLLGLVSPYVVKLRLNNLADSGTTIGNLYALSTAGSIFGTFGAGFYLIPNFGTNKILLFLAIFLFCLSLFVYGKSFLKLRIFFLIFILFVFSLFSQLSYLLNKQGFIDIDTAYNRIWIYDFYDEETKKDLKIMGINNEPHSLMFLDNDELVSDYLKYYQLAEYFKPDFKETLMIGGAGYSYPKYYLKNYPQAKIDVLEIDPTITELAKKYFRLVENDRLSIFHEDARVYLNLSQKNMMLF